MNKLKEAIKILEVIEGLDNIVILNEKDKTFIKNTEISNNIGVFDCLKKKNLLFITHDERFREPQENLVIEENGKLIFPSIQFIELSKFKAISSSPSSKLHNPLVKHLKLKIKDHEASIIIGFD